MARKKYRPSQPIVCVFDVPTLVSTTGDQGFLLINESRTAICSIYHLQGVQELWLATNHHMGWRLLSMPGPSFLRELTQNTLRLHHHSVQTRTSHTQTVTRTGACCPGHCQVPREMHCPTSSFMTSAASEIAFCVPAYSRAVLSERRRVPAQTALSGPSEVSPPSKTGGCPGRRPALSRLTSYRARGSEGPGLIENLIPGPAP